MTLLVVGLSHRTAPVSVLDQVALGPADSLALQRDVLQSAYVAESLVLSTCNRIEMYADVARFHGAVDELTDRLCKQAGIGLDDVAEHLYVHYDDRAARHLFEVAAGLDSMIVGEQQILGQVRHSLRVAQEAATAGRALNDLGQTALRVGKRVHAETGIDRAGASVVSVALEAAAGHLGGALAGRRALVVGAGAMSSLAVATLARSGVASIVIANRTPSRAHRLAESVAPDVESAWISLAQVAGELADIDVLVSCTGSQGLVVTRDQVEAVLPQRAGRPLVVVDLALPHDTDPELAALPGVVRIDLARLAELPDARASESDVALARRIVDEELEAYVAAQAALRVAPVVVSLRARASDVVDAELGRLRLRLAGVDDRVMFEVERSLRRTVSTLLHTPTVRMKQLASDPEGTRYAEVVRALFDLDSGALDAVSGGVEVVPAEIADDGPADGTPEVRP